jgi:hypothetical protein
MTTGPQDGDPSDDDEENEFEPNDDGGTLLDKARRVRQKLNASSKQDIESIYNEFDELWEVLLELNDHGNGQGAGPGLAKSLGINISLLNKFVNQRNSVKMTDARMIADRLVTYLRSEQPSATRFPGTFGMQFGGQFAPEAQPTPAPFVVKAVEWKLVVRSYDIQAEISEIGRLLSEVIQHATATNLAPAERALSEIERAQLIAILKTAITMLEAPMIEKGLLKKAKEAMEKGALKAVEKGVENAFSFAVGVAVGKLTDFTGHIF